MFDGKKFKEKRNQLRLSAEDLARQFGTTKESIYKWEDGTIPRNPEMFKKIMAWMQPGETQDYKAKYYELLEKYTLLLEKIKK